MLSICIGTQNAFATNSFSTRHEGAEMKKDIAGQFLIAGGSETDGVPDEELGTFLSILNNLSKTLRDLGYPEEGEMLMGVRADIQQRLRISQTFPN
jgi:hypothetical protein